MNNWNINSLKKERENIKRNIIKLNNAKQRKRLIALHNKRKGIMSNREIENHKKYIKKTLKDIKKTKKIDPITKKIKVLEANNLTNSRIRHSNTLYRFLRERPERVKPKRLLQNFKTAINTMKKNGESNAKIKNRKEIFNRNKRKYRLKLNKAKKDLKNIMP